ncbi:hypothetical protein FB45DRAFT_738161 [Roridomyces roridus]|uniref:AB hydrolase-1 domain-containing protein n=1 Tax=Roridomyces roridus TaxID=1738132 RepID=A0AAD7C7I8_9AGAR|nr:hypothetical protein FB45DRAFT_738161 [Roridomyces roridus]
MDYTEHTVKLPDGIEILYTDSGAPESFPYTTLLLLHGSAFSGDSMVGLHQYAHKNDMRVVLWNRRGYRGSTGYTDSEIEDLKTGRRVFQDRLALQLAWFFRHFMYQENIPKVSTDRKVGGFILGGWSFGNTASLSLFGDPGVLPRDLYDYIEPYVLSLVLYDPPYTALGLLPFPNQAEVYNPWTDPDCPTAEARVENFQHWVSAYHEHPEISSGKISYTKRPERSTLASWTEEMKARYIDGEAASRCDIPAYALHAFCMNNRSIQMQIRTDDASDVQGPNLPRVIRSQNRVVLLSGSQCALH